MAKKSKATVKVTKLSNGRVKMEFDGGHWILNPAYDNIAEYRKLAKSFSK